MGDWEQILLERRLLWWTSLLVLAGTGLWVLALATPYWLVHLPGNNTHTPVGTAQREYKYFLQVKIFSGDPSRGQDPGAGVGAYGDLDEVRPGGGGRGGGGGGGAALGVLGHDQPPVTVHSHQVEISQCREKATSKLMNSLKNLCLLNRPLLITMFKRPFTIVS